MRGITVVTGPRSELVSERKRHSRPQVLAIGPRLEDVGAAERQYSRACNARIYERTGACTPRKRRETPAQRYEHPGESLDARRAFRMGWCGMERNGCSRVLATSLVAASIYIYIHALVQQCVLYARVHVSVNVYTRTVCAACRIAYTVPAVWD